MAARHLGLQHGLVRHPARVEGDEPRADPVGEHDERRRRVVDDAGQRPHVGTRVDDEGVVERHPQRKQLAQGGAAAREQHGAMGVLEDRALDERSALTLDPVEVVTVGPAAAARLGQRVLHEDAHALALVLVHPLGVQVDADDR